MPQGGKRARTRPQRLFVDLPTRLHGLQRAFKAPLVIKASSPLYPVYPNIYHSSPCCLWRGLHVVGGGIYMLFVELIRGEGPQSSILLSLVVVDVPSCL